MPQVAGAEEETNVRVAARIRPLLPRDTAQNCCSCVTVHPNVNQVVVGTRRAFTFDLVYETDASQLKVYDGCVSQLLEGCMQGYNATVLAYGQTGVEGSGKTHTMGTGPAVGEGTDEEGIVPKVIRNSFQHIEMHKEHIDFKGLIAIREAPAGGIKVSGIHAEVCRSAEEMFRCLSDGSVQRTTGATLMNEQSSRSHSIFTLILEQRNRLKCDLGDGCIEDYYVTAKFHLVDLAGSERAKRTGAVGSRFKESVLLQDSLGGNSRTVMIACVSCADIDFEETLNTLKYAHRARNIKNKPVINHDPKQAQLAAMQDEIEALREQLQRANGTNGCAPAAAIGQEETSCNRSRVAGVLFARRRNEESEGGAFHRSLADLYTAVCNQLPAIWQGETGRPALGALCEALSQAQRLLLSEADSAEQCDVSQLPLPPYHLDTRASQQNLSEQLQSLEQHVLLKEELITELTRSEQEWGLARKQYQARMEQLQLELEDTQRQLDLVKVRLQESEKLEEQARQVNEEEKRRLERQVSEQVEALKRKQQEYARLKELRHNERKRVKDLEVEVTQMRQSQAELDRRLQAERRREAQQIQDLRRRLTREGQKVKDLEAWRARQTMAQTAHSAKVVQKPSARVPSVGARKTSEREPREPREPRERRGYTSSECGERGTAGSSRWQHLEQQLDEHIKILEATQGLEEDLRKQEALQKKREQYKNYRRTLAQHLMEEAAERLKLLESEALWLEQENDQAAASDCPTRSQQRCEEQTELQRNVQRKRSEGLSILHDIDERLEGLQDELDFRDARIAKAQQYLKSTAGTGPGSLDAELERIPAEDGKELLRRYCEKLVKLRQREKQHWQRLEAAEAQLAERAQQVKELQQVLRRQDSNATKAIAKVTKEYESRIRSLLRCWTTIAKLDSHVIHTETERAIIKRVSDIFLGPTFEFATAILLIFNLLLMAAQLQYHGIKMGHEMNYPHYDYEPEMALPGAENFFLGADVAFAIIFTLEMLIRFSKIGWLYFKNLFNWVDFVVVCSSWVELFAAALPISPTFLRMLRLGKLLRAIRVVKMSQVLESLQLLLKCIHASLRRPFLTKVPATSILVDNVGEGYSAVFIIYRCFVGFAVLNVVNAVFVQSTMKVAQADDELMSREKARTQAAYHERITALFRQVDTSGDGMIDASEFQELLQHPKLQLWLHQLEVETNDLVGLFNMLDDGDGEISLEEFESGLMRIKGIARSYDLNKLQRDISRMSSKMDMLFANSPYTRGLIREKMDRKKSLSNVEQVRRDNQYYKAVNRELKRRLRSLLEQRGEADAEPAPFWERLEVQCQAEAQTLLEPSLDSIWEMLREGEEMMQLAQARSALGAQEIQQYWNQRCKPVFKREAVEDPPWQHLEKAKVSFCPDPKTLGVKFTAIYEKTPEDSKAFASVNAGNGKKLKVGGGTINLQFAQEMLVIREHSFYGEEVARQLVLGVLDAQLADSSSPEALPEVQFAYDTDVFRQVWEALVAKK
eukprot:g21311.t1